MPRVSSGSEKENITGKLQNQLYVLPSEFVYQEALHFYALSKAKLSSCSTPYLICRRTDRAEGWFTRQIMVHQCISWEKEGKGMSAG